MGNICDRHDLHLFLFPVQKGMNKLMKSPKNLILYKDFENGNLFYNMTWIMENYENEYYNKEDVESLLYESLNQLMELAVSLGFVGNLWHSFLAFIHSLLHSHNCQVFSIGWSPLYHKLSHFIYNGINMNKIESRPVQGKAWEYRFFVDIGKPQ